VRLLIDESLQHDLAGVLSGHGHDAVHVADVGLQGAPDVGILTKAAADDRVVVTADTDFGTLLALSGASGPSVVLLRRSGRRVPERVRIVLTVLDLVKDQLTTGAVVTVDNERVRIRPLPVNR
jgi:predicted nuclease of predicted toxin-antitoxin system